MDSDTKVDAHPCYSETARRRILPAENPELPACMATLMP